MEFKSLSPLSLFEVKEVLDNSPNFVRSNNITDTQAFAEKLFLEEIPGDVFFELITIDKKVIGFVKYSKSFPLPGFTHLRLLVLKEKDCGKGYGSQIIQKLKGPGTLWIESPKEQFSLPFWEAKGFKEEAGRWVLN